MADPQLDYSSANEILKEKYPDGQLVSLVGASSLIQKLAPFSTADSTGLKYVQPVILSQPSGYTFNAPTDDYAALNRPITGSIGRAEVDGFQITLREGVGTGILARAQKAGKESFISAIDLVFRNMTEGASKKVEIENLYGQMGLGKTSSSTGTTLTETVVFTAASWAAGIWAGTLNMQVNFYYGAAMVNGSTGIFTVTDNDTENRTITVSGAAADITALHSAVNTTGHSLDVYYNGAYGNEMAGLVKLVSTTSGTIYNIAVKDLWKPNQFAVGGALDLAKILKMNSRCFQRGLDEPCVHYINSDVFAGLSGTQAGLRLYDKASDIKTANNAVQSLTFNAPAGEIEVAAHPFMKTGDSLMLPKSRLKRIGASDITFNVPGYEGKELFLVDPNYNGVEFRLYTSQAIFLETPARACYGNGITA